MAQAGMHAPILGPHHDVGVSDDLKQRAMEYAHYPRPPSATAAAVWPGTRSVMKGLGVPVHNQYRLRPLPFRNETAPTADKTQ